MDIFEQVYPQFRKEFKEGETTVVFSFWEGNEPFYKCKVCGWDRVGKEDEFCEKCERKIL